MMTPFLSKSRTRIGIVVSRFQESTLSQVHQELIFHALDSCNTMIVVLSISRIKPNPADNSGWKQKVFKPIVQFKI